MRRHYRGCLSRLEEPTMTVVIPAGERDPAADQMIKVLAGRGVEVVRCDTAWFPASAATNLDVPRPTR